MSDPKKVNDKKVKKPKGESDFDFKKTTEEEDKAEKEEKEKYELYVQRLQDSNLDIRRKALDEIKNEVSSATSSMTSVPKPLKYMRPHYDTLKEFYEKCDGEFKRELSDLLSVLAITMSEKGSNESLKFVLAGTQRNLTDWGNEYLRSLAGEVSSEYNERFKNEQSTEELNFLVDIITPFCVQHKEEIEAVDLLMEVEQLHKITHLCTDDNYSRICLYLRSCAPFAADQEEMNNILTTTYKIYLKLGKYPEALLIAQKMDDADMIKEVMESCQDPVITKQLCLMLGRQRTNYEMEDEDLFKIISYERLSEHFRSLARDLDTLEPKTPEQIFKSHLEEKKTEAKIDSFKENLATTYCNGFLNAGYGTDKLMTVNADDEWIWKNKDSGMTAAAASLGLLHLWDIDEGFAKIDKYMESTNDLIRAGAYMAVGIINSGIKNDSDPVFALLGEHIESDNEYTKIGALMGLSFTYAGTAREDIMELISPIVLDGDSSIELASIAGLVLGLIFWGTCNDEVANCIIQTCMEREPQDLDNPHARYLALGLGLLYFGKQDVVEASLIGVSVIEHPISRFMEIIMKGCAYACSGNVLKIQELLHICAEHEEKKEGEEENKNTNHFQSVAVLSLGLIAFGEDISSEMAMRTMNHFLQYGEPELKRAVPLAIALLGITQGMSAGGKTNHVMDLLGKLSYDGDSELAINAILAQGIIWAGTNNSRLAGNLRQLASYYNRDPDNLLMVRIAQGLVSTGKGLINLQPVHSERILQSNVALSGILWLLMTCTNTPKLFFGRHHTMLYYLVLAMYPRMMVALDENLEPLQVDIRVGQAVDTVGMPGQPKTITGFQTHKSPVLLNYGERAELGTEEYLPVSPIIENFVILRKNPDYKPPEEVKVRKY